MLILRPYQIKAIREAATQLARGIRKLIIQLPTGAGKTILFCEITQSFLKKNPKKSVLILVHREVLLNQTRKVLFKEFGISCQVIVKGMKVVPKAQVYVGMVESVNRRIKIIGDVDMLIIDECHINLFNKLHQHFTSQYVIGVTATPVSASRKDPLKNYYKEIVTCVSIRELIELNKNEPGQGLCQNITYSPKDIVERAELTMRGGDFDESQMSTVFSKPRYVNSTVKAYETWGVGKCMVFNCSIEHSREVDKAFRLARYNSKYIDSTMPANERKAIMKWYKETDDAVLNNVGILTAGFDEPTIETIIFNRCTKSIPLFIQCLGRGSRPIAGKKDTFIIIDMGGNAIDLKVDWSTDINWRDLFLNPPKVKNRDDGISPVKSCPNCDAIVPSQARVCLFCDYVFPAKIVPAENELGEFVVITKGIDIDKMIEKHKDNKEYRVFFKLGHDVAQMAKNNIRVMTDEVAEKIQVQYFELAKDWCHKKNKRFSQWHKDKARLHLYEQLAKHYPKWKNPFPQQVAVTVSKSIFEPFTIGEIVNLK